MMLVLLGGEKSLQKQGALRKSRQMWISADVTAFLTRSQKKEKCQHEATNPKGQSGQNTSD